MKMAKVMKNERQKAEGRRQEAEGKREKEKRRKGEGANFGIA